jgi:hypothetical protein
LRRPSWALVAFAVLAAAIIGVGFWLSHPSSGAPEVDRTPGSLPTVGSCWSVDENTARNAFPWPGQPVDCAASHTAEVFFYHQVDPALARKAATATGDDATVQQNLMYAQARRTCTVLASTYLGGNWHSARVRVIADWIKPQRSGWFGCALAETTDPAGDHFVRRTGSLRNGAAGLAVDCVSRDGPALVYTPCAQAHDGEYVGTFTVTPAEAPFDETGVRNAATKGCTHAALGFLGLAADANRPDLRAGYVGPSSGPEWLGSDQTFACYLLSVQGRLKGSVKGLGNRPLPSI